MAEHIEFLLALTPRVRDPGRQQSLTHRFLTPALPALETLLLELRAELDPVLRQAQSASRDKPYPYGQCLEITEAVHRRLESLDPAGLSVAAACGYAALRDFRNAGGELRHAWGGLRGEYFQNALIVGTLYVDVSNDTVVPTKPKVQILPFADSAFTAITDYGHFARIAVRYWKYRFLPNHLLPELAPYLPFIEISPKGEVRLGSTQRHMVGLTLASRFTPSERVLENPAVSAAVFADLSAALHGGPMAVAASAETGREAALGFCRRYRAEGRAECAESYARAMLAGAEANRRLARLTVAPKVA